jgi:hypothetical protein
LLKLGVESVRIHTESAFIVGEVKHVWVVEDLRSAFLVALTTNLERLSTLQHVRWAVPVQHHGVCSRPAVLVKMRGSHSTRSARSTSHVETRRRFRLSSVELSSPTFLILLTTQCHQFLLGSMRPVVNGADAMGSQASCGHQRMGWLFLLCWSVCIRRLDLIPCW